MPANTQVKPALELIEQDSSKVLGLTVGGKHSITTPGQYVPRVGEFGTWKNGQLDAQRA